MRIVLSGGGTGGHATPLLALTAALKHQHSRLKLYYIGSGNQLEQDIAKQAGLEYQAILSGKFRRYHRGFAELTDIRTINKNIADSTRFIRGTRQAMRMIKRIKPDAVFVNGGYVGLPVGLAASLLRIPLVIHESDTIMGLTNRILARRARAIATGFPVEVYPAKLQGKLTHVGNVIADEFMRTKAAAKPMNSKPTLLIIGGSTGARHINEATWQALPQLITRATVIHQTGQHSIEDADQQRQQLASGKRAHYQPFAFADTPTLAKYMGAADVVISRAGANSLFELAAMGCPTIIVPLANSANNHQVHNARYMAMHHAAHVISESDLSSSELAETIDYLLDHYSLRKELGENLRKLATPHAAQALAKLILKEGS